MKHVGAVLFMVTLPLMLAAAAMAMDRLIRPRRRVPHLLQAHRAISAKFEATHRAMHEAASQSRRRPRGT